MKSDDMYINVLFQDTGIIYNEMKKINEIQKENNIDDLKDRILQSIKDNTVVDKENNVISIKY